MPLLRLKKTGPQEAEPMMGLQFLRPLKMLRVCFKLSFFFGAFPKAWNLFLLLFFCGVGVPSSPQFARGFRRDLGPWCHHVRSCIYFAEGTQYSVEHFRDTWIGSVRRLGLVGETFDNRIWWSMFMRRKFPMYIHMYKCNYTYIYTYTNIYTLPKTNMDTQNSHIGKEIHLKNITLGIHVNFRGCILYYFLFDIHKEIEGTKSTCSFFAAQIPSIPREGLRLSTCRRHTTSKYQSPNWNQRIVVGIHRKDGFLYGTHRLVVCCEFLVPSFANYTFL